MRLFQYRRAGAVVVDGDRVLLCSLQPPGERRWWHFPGGGIEPGESPREAAVRELQEETGLVAASATEYLRAGVHGGNHHYFLVECDDLRIGEVTGPELDYAADSDFRAEWVPIADLVRVPVFPRCVAEHLAAHGTAVDGVPWYEDDRGSWDGLPGEDSPPGVRFAARALVTSATGGIAAIRRVRDGERYHTLPGGGLEPGEAAEDAVVREVHEELGLEAEVTGKLAVVVYRRGDAVSMQTYFSCAVAGGELGTGDGNEYTAERQRERGTYEAVWLDPDNLPADLKPTWLADRVPAWLQHPSPERPERFCEVHDA